MQNEFVEDIIVKGRKDRNAPSPVTYEPAKTFGKTGIHFSVPGKFDRYGERVEKNSNHYLELQRKLPGPGYYSTLDTVGAKVCSSTIRSSEKPQFSKAHDRFFVPTEQVKSPSPNKYQPKFNLGQDISSR